ncbi:2OG-Fe(II) oxygenase [Caballeronia catudaia]|uniref:2OG-Fe(II) oxygenase n=1 Tax=Caballeronia catudaia TaxID=1777136 RepID=A0A158AQA0_9BURK|nr:2OG-Fe(II) oxygenase [Caballeronia catudaia]SAK59207.1 2OG-Fe(II) oxygenase [Caballeronia catudaia]
MSDTATPVNTPMQEAQAAPAARLSKRDIESTLNARLAALQTSKLRDEYGQQGSFLYIEDFLPRDYTERLIAAVHDVTPAVNRNYLPGHKAGGSVSRHTLDKLAPFIADLYRSDALIKWLEAITGDKLQLSPDDDPHAYALYFYTRPGDHIGWHYDTSYYEGRRYTLLLGVIDDSSCALNYELHTKTPGKAAQPGAVQYPPGAFVFFDGDKLRHRVTPLGENEMRVSLTFEYVTNPNMRPFQRFISNMKDSIAYFGFRQVFRRKGGKNGQA